MKVRIALTVVVTVEKAENEYSSYAMNRAQGGDPTALLDVEREMLDRFGPARYIEQFATFKPTTAISVDIVREA